MPCTIGPDVSSKTESECGAVQREMLGGSVAIHKYKEGSWTVKQRMQHMRQIIEKKM